MATDDEFDEVIEDEEGLDLDEDDDIELDDDDDIELDDDDIELDDEFEGDDADAAPKDDPEEVDEEEEVEDDLDEEDDEAEESLEILLGRDHDDEPEVTAESRNSLTKAAHPIGEGEFTCRSCFLVKRRAQLADPKKLICLDCA